MTSFTKAWFEVLEYLIIVGVLKVVAEKSIPPVQYVLAVIATVSHVLLFFYCLNVFVPLIQNRKISGVWARLISGAIGAVLAVTIQLVAKSLAV